MSAFEGLIKFWQPRPPAEKLGSILGRAKEGNADKLIPEIATLLETAERPLTLNFESAVSTRTPVGWQRDDQIGSFRTKYLIKFTKLHGVMSATLQKMQSTTHSTLDARAKTG
jgi:hypothetical protein